MTDFEAEFVRRNVLCHALAMAPCLRDEASEMRRTAEDSLTRHLPTVQPEDIAWITEEQVRSLLAAVDPRRPDLTVAILNAVRHVGDRRAIAAVTGLFGRIAQTDHPDEIAVRDAAYSCLVHLRERAAQTKVAASLLRGSQRPASESATILLRPADGTAAPPATELLRAAEPEA
jgi:hypothetical protein